MLPPNTPAELFRHGTITQWFTYAGGISSVLVAPAIVMVAAFFAYRRLALGNWCWLVCALPGLVAFVQFAFEVHRLAADIGEVWSREWNFAHLFAMAYARIYLGSACSVLFFLMVAMVKLWGRRNGGD